MKPIGRKGPNLKVASIATIPASLQRSGTATFLVCTHEICRLPLSYPELQLHSQQAGAMHHPLQEESRRGWCGITTSCGRSIGSNYRPPGYSCHSLSVGFNPFQPRAQRGYTTSCSDATGFCVRGHSTSIHIFSLQVLPIVLLFSSTYSDILTTWDIFEITVVHTSILYIQLMQAYCSSITSEVGRGEASR